MSGGPLVVSIAGAAVAFGGLGVFLYCGAMERRLRAERRTAPPRDLRPLEPMPPSLAPMFRHPHPSRRGRGQIRQSTCRGARRAR
jgi:hypothetical protein